VAVLLSVGVALVAAYPQGPPIQIEGVCTDMFPTGHGVEKQSGDPPYEYVLSQECYKEGVAVHVAIKATHEMKDKRYFEGFFTQVQENNVKDVSYGTFSTEDDEYSNTYNCFNAPDSAVGHMKKEHFTARVFTWNPPAGVTNKTLHFRSTVVKNKETFWTDMMSEPLTYDAACVKGDFTEEEGIEKSDSHEDETSAATSLLPGMFAAIATLLLSLLL